MLALCRPAIVLFLLLSAITGVAYPLAVTVIAQLVFPEQANGSLITDKNGRAVGSSLIGQDFSSGEPAAAAKFFWGRLSATGPVAYTSFNADKLTGSSGSNVGPTNPALLDSVRSRIAQLDAADTAVGVVRVGRTQGGERGQLIPIDLVTASGSGLDPHISLAAAEYQVPRVAKARGMTEESVRQLVRDHTIGRTFGVLGEPVVHVLKLNLALQHSSEL